MKQLNLTLILLVCLAWVWPNKVNWRWHGNPIMAIHTNEGATLELGLCSDGTVVWREIMASTNSPSEVALTNFLLRGDMIINTNVEYTTPRTNKFYWEN